MNQIVECVPNFSEGRNKETIAAIADAIRSTEGCTLLDIDPGASTNRTVYTFVANPEAVVEGAMNAATAARAHIDMTRHSGEHPRFGAMDVCPFIPVANVTMAECVPSPQRLVNASPRRWVSLYFCMGMPAKQPTGAACPMSAMVNTRAWPTGSKMKNGSPISARLHSYPHGGPPQRVPATF
jgi:hypothetical protein